jgi:hypothetical protein
MAMRTPSSSRGRLGAVAGWKATAAAIGQRGIGQLGGALQPCFQIVHFLRLHQAQMALWQAHVLLAHHRAQIVEAGGQGGGEHFRMTG